LEVKSLAKIEVGCLGRGRVGSEGRGRVGSEGRGRVGSEGRGRVGSEGDRKVPIYKGHLRDCIAVSLVLLFNLRPLITASKTLSRRVSRNWKKRMKLRTVEIVPRASWTFDSEPRAVNSRLRRELTSRGRTRPPRDSRSRGSLYLAWSR
jgi:hypothetical protein